jgi:hypothetical protein
VYTHKKPVLMFNLNMSPHNTCSRFYHPEARSDADTGMHVAKISFHSLCSIRKHDKEKRMAVRLKQRAATEERVEARKNATCSRPEEGGCNPDGKLKTSSPLTSPSKLALTRVMTHGRRWDSAKADEGEPPPSRRFKDRVVVRQ